MTPSSQASAKILVVDDDQMVRESIADLLASAGHDVMLASNGDECLAMLEHEAIDLVVLDILMPGCDGFETMRALRKTHSSLPVLAISGGDRTGWNELLRLATALGASDSIAKPFAVDDFMMHVQRLLGREASH